MSNIYKAFENKKAFIPFVTGGDPDLETTKNLLIAMEKAGADLIEIGIPFSDPIAEGPVIQEASQRALAAGCTTDKLFDMVKEARQRVKIPMVFMTYINPVYTYGKERFMKRCVECGIDGIIVPDLPYEEKEELSGVCVTFFAILGTSYVVLSGVSLPLASVSDCSEAVLCYLQHCGIGHSR